MISFMMFITTAIFSLITNKFYPEWSWLPQSELQLVAEGIIVVMMFASVIMIKIEDLARKIDKK